MNPLEELVNNFQDLVGQVPELIQPFILILAGAIPFIDGEGAAIIGIVGGINPIGEYGFRVRLVRVDGTAHFG